MRSRAGAALAVAVGFLAVAPAASAGLRADAQAARINFGSAAEATYLADRPYAQLLRTYGNTISFENETKWRVVHPERDRYDFSRADKLARWSWRNGMRMHGHVLAWHVNNPQWLKDLEPTRREAIGLLRDHIEVVVGHFDRRFPGLVTAWDVVNEAIDNDGSRREGIWQTWIGDDYVELAFRFAREAAGPDIELVLNDYYDNVMMAGAEAIGGEFDDGDPFPMTTPGASGSLGCDEVIKCSAARELVDELLDAGAPIDTVGFQAHIPNPEPSDYRALTSWVGDRGLRWALTELDVPVPDSGGDPGGRTHQAETFAAATDACIDDPACDTVVTWGASDRYTWWTALTSGGIDDALPYDTRLEPKQAVASLSQTLNAGATPAACPGAPRPRLRLPGWVKRKRARAVRLIVVGSGRSRDVRRGRRFVRVPLARHFGREIEVRINGAIGKPPDARIRRDRRILRVC